MDGDQVTSGQLAVVTARLVVNGDLYTGTATLPRDRWTAGGVALQNQVHAVVLERLMLGIIKDQHPTTTVSFIDGVIDTDQ